MKTLESPKRLPALQRLQWILDPVGYLECTHQRYPDLFRSPGIGFGDDIVIVSHPQAIQYILMNDRKLFHASGELNLILEPLIGDASVIAIEGDRHKQRRQLIMPSFHGDRLSIYGETICKLTQSIFDAIPPGETFSARTITQQVSLQIIFDIVFGLSEGEKSQQIKTLLTAMADRFSSPLASALLFFKSLQKNWGPRSPWGYFLQLREQLDHLIYAELQDRRTHPDDSRTDILSLMMAARDEEGQPMTDKELRDEIMTLLFAGHETTATAMAWALYWLHRCPEVKTKLLAELDSLDGETDPMTIAKQPYLTAVCQETLRRNPVAMLTFPRVAQEPVEILGYQFEAGTIFMGCMYLTLQRDDLYPNPKAFRPERFLEKKYSPYEFIPFGNGARRCVGEALALYEMKLAIATAMMNYQMELADSRSEVPRRRGVTLAPSRGVSLRMIGKRSKPESGAIASDAMVF
ncbi:MAG: cytochrome P450 [Synechococcales cyanobacterium T60_A2020_003]|nr:cytochrome P450 [Synechococcales cyanobacterium T60_A2020_003]